MLKKVTTLLIALAATLLSVGPIQAWDYSTCFGTRITWDHSNVTLYPSTVSFSGSYRDALDAVVNAWNTAPGANFRFTLSYDNATTWSKGDGKSSVIFTRDGFNSSGDALAVTYRQYRTGCYGLGETDVAFNLWYNWTSEITPFNLPAGGDGSHNVVLVGIHEFGHAFGLNHQENSLSTMSAHYPVSGPMGNGNYILPQADDVLGNRVGYGTCCTARDVYASAYQVTGVDTTDRIRQPNVAYRGNQASFPFSIGNRGTENESSVRVNFYFSTDRFIDASDYYLGAATYSLNSGSAGTYNATVTIPTSLPSGNYYFGWIVDPLNTISEVNEQNNAVALSGPTVIPDSSPPTACISAYPTYGTAPLSVSFDGTCSSDPDGQVVSYQWDFGDGSIDTGASVQHWYSSPGYYTATLTVTDNSGFTSQQVQSVTVTDPSCPNCIM
jgi:hypothetical protein